MIMRRSALALAALGLALGLSAPAVAQSSQARFDAFVQRLKPEAMRAGVSAQLYDRAFRGAKVDQEAIDKSNTQLEFKQSIAVYLDTQVSDTRIANGKANAAKFADLLARIERTYGVDRYVVLGVWGMETNYGASMGGHNVIEALATLACCATRRPDFFRKELIAALQILQQGNVAPENMIGSWAGAMGQTQFMPTSFKAYAADGDGDGRRDIWGSTADALASTANYLKRHGWKMGTAWGREVTGGAGGGKLFTPAGPNGPAFLTTGNYRVIKRYNNSDSYALAVAHLSDRIRGGGPFQTAWPNHDKPLDEPGRFELQALLARRGFDVGEPDGKIGPATRTAIISYQKAQGLLPDGYASVSLLRRMKTGR